MLKSYLHRRPNIFLCCVVGLFAHSFRMHSMLAFAQGCCLQRALACIGLLLSQGCCLQGAAGCMGLLLAQGCCLHRAVACTRLLLARGFRFARAGPCTGLLFGFRPCFALGCSLHRPFAEHQALALLRACACMVQDYNGIRKDAPWSSEQCAPKLS